MRCCESQPSGQGHNRRRVGQHVMGADAAVTAGWSPAARHPSEASESEWRWDDFCKLDLPRQLRLIYLWEPETPFITLVLIGPHLAQGQLDNVYDALAEAFDLPLDEGHAQLGEQPCCADVNPDGRTVPEENGKRTILQMAKR
jgi:hypothetical protein